MNTLSRMLLYAPLVLAVTACHPDEIVNSEPAASSQPAGHAGLNAAIVFLTLPGDQAFAQECATCHTPKDGFDLAYFSYTDTNIVRRALGHVDTATAWRISDYIRTLQTPKVPETTRLFQPGGVVLANDVAFAVTLFGTDQWPATLTRAQLLALDPVNVKVSVPFPRWSDEVTKTLEWVPKQPLDSATLHYANNRVSSAIATYEAAPTVQTLSLAMVAINEVTKTAANPGAPCPYLWRKTQVDFVKCFNARVWAAGMAAEYMTRRGLTGFLDSRVHQVAWDAGFVSFQSGQQHTVPTTGDPTNQAERWFYLGWMFDPAHVQALYTTSFLRGRSRNRQATWVAERSLVARLPGVFMEDVNPYVDFLEMAISTPSIWAVNAATFGFNELLRRLHLGDRPTGAALTTARTQVNTAMTKLTPKVTAAQLVPLRALANQVLGLL